MYQFCSLKLFDTLFYSLLYMVLQQVTSKTILVSTVLKYYQVNHARLGRQAVDYCVFVPYRLCPSSLTSLHYVCCLGPIYEHKNPPKTIANEQNTQKKKSCVISSHVWVKYGQTQPLGFIYKKNLKSGT